MHAMVTAAKAAALSSRLIVECLPNVRTPAAGCAGRIRRAKGACERLRAQPGRCPREKSVLAERAGRRSGKPRQLSAHQARNARCVWGGRRCQCGEIPADGTVVGVRSLAPRASGVLDMGPGRTPVVRRHGVADAQRRRQRKLRCREQHRHEARPPAWANHLPEAYVVTRREAIAPASGSSIRMASAP